MREVDNVTYKCFFATLLFIFFAFSVKRGIEVKNVFFITRKIYNK